VKSGLCVNGEDEVPALCDEEKILRRESDNNAESCPVCMAVAPKQVISRTSSVSALSQKTQTCAKPKAGFGLSTVWATDSSLY